MAKITSGDTVFNRSGSVLTVGKVNPQSGKAELSSAKGDPEKPLRHGIVNGLSPDQRNSFNEILDKVRQEPDLRQRIDVLQKAIEDVEAVQTEPHLAKYLKAEMVHLMNSSGYTPQNYSIEIANVKTTS